MPKVRRSWLFTAGRLEAVLLAGVLAIAAALVGISGVNVNNNGAIYLLQADQIMERQAPGLTFADRSARGPVFPFLLAVGMALGGKTTAVAMVVVRLFFVLGLVIVYLFQRSLFGRAVAVATVLLVATSNGLNLTGGSLDTDGVHPTFVCLFLLAYWIAYKRTSLAWAVCAGFALALAVLTKESAIGFLIVPLATVLARDRTVERVRRVILPACAAAVVPIAAWAAAVTVAYGTVDAALGMMHPALQKDIAELAGAPGPLAYWARLLTIGMPAALWSYVGAHMTQASSIAPAFAAAWLVVLVYALRRRQAPELVIAAAGVAFLPVILRLGDYPVARVGQSSITFMLSYLALGGALGLIAGTLAAGRRRSLVATVGILLVGIGGAWHQLTFAAGPIPPTATIWREGATGAFPLSIAGGNLPFKPFKVLGRFTEDQESAAAWIRTHGEPGAAVAGDGFSHEAIEFFLTNSRPVSLFHPLVTLSVSTLEAFDPRRLEGPAAFAMTYGRFDVAETGREMFLSSQELIRSALDRAAVDYLVVSGRGQWVSEYFARVPWAAQVFRLGSVSVFQIDRRGGMPLAPWPEVCVNEAFPEHIHWLASTAPGDAARLREALAPASLRLEEAIGTSCRIPRGQTP